MTYRPGKLEVAAYDNSLESGRDVLCTVGEIAKLQLPLGRPNVFTDGQDLAFLTIQAVDVDGNLVYDENGYLTVNGLDNRILLALGSADPKSNRVKAQIPGVTEVISTLYDTASGEVWSRERVHALDCLL